MPKAKGDSVSHFSEQQARFGVFFCLSFFYCASLSFIRIGYRFYIYFPQGDGGSIYADNYMLVVVKDNHRARIGARVPRSIHHFTGRADYVMGERWLFFSMRVFC